MTNATNAEPPSDQPVQLCPICGYPTSWVECLACEGRGDGCGMCGGRGGWYWCETALLDGARHG